MPKGRLEKKIYYHDTDCGGVVYHAAYLNHLEEGRAELLREKGIDVGELARQGTIFPVVHIEIDYKCPAVYGDTVEIATSIEKVGHASIDFTQEIKRGSALLLKAKVVCACVDTNLKAKPIPEAELSKLKIV
ncbi:MAG: YbgC/FadM family acyl-CoA thioesterase [Candidatus Omnitrophica bacterium]|nr:YbgC/FadM family acyl-CoA thioesterase [Candidatus Omnitrophota bacterium]